MKTSFPGKMLIVGIRGYQKVFSLDTGLMRYLFPHKAGLVCMYYPTCSEYAVLAIEKYGALKGGRKALRRIGSCRPGKSPAIDLP
jgi:putative membrane protein insertion efficiency factor